MSQYLKEYSPDKVNLTYAGVAPIKGVAEGTFVEVARNAPRTEVEVGAFGDAAITKTANRTGTVTVTLLQNSPSNTLLSAVVNKEDIDGSLFRGDFVVEDPSGAVIAIAKRCHIQEPANITLGNNQNAKVWVFFSEDITYLDLPEGVSSENVADVSNTIAAIEAVSEEYKTILS